MNPPIFFDQSNLDSAMECRDELQKFLQRASSPGFKGGDSPIPYVQALEALREGSSQDRSLAALLGGMERLLEEVGAIAASVNDLKGGTDDYMVQTVEWSPEGREVDILAWTSTALSMLGADMRAIVMARLGFDSGRLRPAKEVAAEFGVPVRSVDQMVRTAFKVWTSESFQEMATGRRYTDYRHLRRVLRGQPRAQTNAAKRESESV